MSLIEVIIRLCVASLLVGYLFVSRRQRAANRPRERQWPGHSIVMTGISERVRRVRGDHISELNLRPDDLGQRICLLASARRVVGRLPYFRALQSRRSAQIKHDLETQTNR